MKRIASENDTEEIEKLVQLVLGCVVQCENNQEYIQRITSLSESSQSELMVRIQKVCCQIEEIKIKPKKNQKKKKKDYERSNNYWRKQGNNFNGNPKCVRK